MQGLENMRDPDDSLVELRKSVGMVFQRTNPLPISVYENVVFGLRIHRERSELKRPVGARSIFFLAPGRRSCVACPGLACCRTFGPP